MGTVCITTGCKFEQFGLSVSLPHNCNINGRLIYDNKNSSRYGYIDMFRVGNYAQIENGIKLSGSGIGTRLLKSFTAELKKYDAKNLIGNCTSESMLRTSAKVFGSQNLVFLNHLTKETIKDMSFEKAISERIFDYDVFVDLDSIDISGWELPITKNEI